MTDFNKFRQTLEEKKGLWDNIHAKRKRIKSGSGEKMRQPGSKGAPTDQDFKDASESVDEKKLTPAEIKKREEIAKAMERDNPDMDMGKKMAIATATAKKVAEQTLDESIIATDYKVGHEKSQFGGYRPHVTHKKTGRTMYLGQHSYKKPEHAKGHADAYLKGYSLMGDRHANRQGNEYANKNQKHQYVKESLDISEISLDMLTKKISNTGMDTTKKANKMDKTKNDLAAMRARLAGKPAMAKEAYEDDEPASPDEASMAMRQLGFIEYAAEEVMDHIKSGKEFPEWMQNKLSKLHGQMESLHSALGEHGEDDEEMKEAVSNNMRLISKIKNSGVVKTGSMAKDTKPAPKKEDDLKEVSKKTLGSYVKKASGSAAGIAAVAAAQAMSSKGKSDPNDKRQLRNRLTGISRATDKLTKEEVAEANRKAAPKMTGDSVAIQRAKDAALNKALGRTKTGRKTPTRTMTSTQRSLASLRNEGVNTADKKPEKFVKPDGTVGVRMVPVDKNIVDKDK